MINIEWGNVGNPKTFYTFTPANHIQLKMTTFIGKYTAKADVKGRVFIPSAYRKILPEGSREQVVMRKDAENQCLVIYPVSIWNEKLTNFKSKLDEWNPVDQMLLMQFVSEAEWLDIDSQGRVLISKHHLEAIGLENAEVLFVGMIDRFAVWSRAKYEEASMSATDFAALLRNRMSNKQED